MRKSNRTKNPGKGKTRKNYKRQKKKNKQPKEPMLNMRKVNFFRYDARQIVAGSQMDEALGPSFIAQVIAKASRNGIKDAKTYIRDFQERGECSKSVSDNFCNLLDRYTRYR